METETNQAVEAAPDLSIPDSSVECDYPGCGKRFKNKHAVSMHKYGTHTEEGRAARKRAANTRKKRGWMVAGRAEGWVKKPKRPYTRRVKPIIEEIPAAGVFGDPPITETSTSSPLHHARFCPSCGCNLVRVAAALTVE